MLNPGQNKSPERAFALQKYLLLHSQHDALQKHLKQITTSLPSTPSRSPDRSSSRSNSSFDDSSLSSSPESPSDFLPPQPPRHHRRRNGMSLSESPVRPKMIKRRSSLPAIIDESIICEVEEEEEKLKKVNEQIKCTLTELLNCESVRSDKGYRMWVQTRLMNTEKELKGDRAKSCERRRQSDAGFSESIGNHWK